METKEKLLREKLNIRCFYLRLLRRLYWLPVGALCGALLSFLLYSLITTFTQPALYEAHADLYLYYVKDATDDRVYDYYNSYTWSYIVQTQEVQDLMREETVLDAARGRFLSSLPEDERSKWEEKSGGQIWEEINPGLQLQGDILADLRILTMTATSTTAEGAAFGAALAAEGLVRFGETNEVLRKAEIMGISSPQPRAYPERRVTAIITGAIIGLLIAILLLWIIYLLDDAVYVPEEVPLRFGLPVMGTLCREKAEGDETYPALLKTELEEHMRQLLRKGRTWQLWEAQDLVEGEKTAALLQKHSDTLRESNVIINTVMPTGPVNEADVRLLLVRAGRRQGALYSHLVAEAGACGRAFDGIILTDTDNGFIRQYYRI